MSDEQSIADIRMDVALLKQEMYFLKDGIKNMHNVFRWVLMLIFGGLATAVVNFIIAGGLKT